MENMENPIPQNQRQNQNAPVEIQEPNRNAIISAIDTNDPLYVHPSDSPNIDLVTRSLKGVENYRVWSREMIAALESKNKLGFITGECKAPPKESPLFQQWRRCNALVTSWIHRSISLELVNGVVYCENAHLIWVDLKDRFDRVDGARLYALYRKINTITQGTNCVGTYYQNLRDLWDEYDSLIPSPSSEISQEYSNFCGQLKVMQFLMGLNESFSGIRTNILMISPLPSHSIVYHMVQNEETQRAINVHSSSLDVSSALLSKTFEKQGSTGNDKEPIKCTHCNYTGHTIDTCFKVHGYPPNWNSRGGRRGGYGGRNRGGRGNTNRGGGRSNNTVNQTPESDNQGHHAIGNTFTPEQYQQLPSLLQNNEKQTNQVTTTNLAADETHLCSESKTWKIMSYNVWFREDLEMHNRMKALGNLIRLHLPDVICFQEVTPSFYKIFRQASWWKEYRCSISGEMEFPGAYFCMQLSKLPVKSYSSKPFHNTIMGRELCVADVEVQPDTSLVVATSHLESPCPSPPTWDQMFSKERVAQAKEAVRFLERNQNVIFCGDMNWDDKLDGPFPLSDGWVDAWTESRPGEVGWTYDTKSNKMISGNRALQKRLDRFLCKLKDFKISQIEMIGKDEIPGLSYVKEKRVKGQVKELVLPVLPSDHYGLLLTVRPRDSS